MRTRSLEEAAFRPTEIARLERMAEAAERTGEHWERAGRVLTIVTALGAALYLCCCVLVLTGWGSSIPQFSKLHVGSIVAAIAGTLLRPFIGAPQRRMDWESAQQYRRMAERLRDEHAALRGDVPRPSLSLEDKEDR